MIRRRHLSVACALLAALTAIGCGRKQARMPASPLPPLPPVVGTTETGVASWYGHPYHGRRAANGEVYDMNELTAAHRTLPFETWLRVFNLTNGKSVDVRVTDRGPFVEGRIIDLSRAAARKIDMIGPGTAPVRLEVIDRPADIERGDVYAVQVGAFLEEANALCMGDLMSKRHGFASVVPARGDPLIWRVLVGEHLSYAAAEQLAARIRAETGEAFVVRQVDDAR